MFPRVCQICFCHRKHIPSQKRKRQESPGGSILLQVSLPQLSKTTITFGGSCQGHQPKMMFPLVRDLALEGIPVSLSCRVLGFPRQGYYAWRAGPVCGRDWSDVIPSRALDPFEDQEPDRVNLRDRAPASTCHQGPRIQSGRDRCGDQTHRVNTSQLAGGERTPPRAAGPI